MFLKNRIRKLPPLSWCKRCNFFFLPSLVRLWGLLICTLSPSPHPAGPATTSNYKLLLNSSAKQSTISHSFGAHRFDNFNVHDLELPFKTTQKLQVLSRWHAGHLPKVPNHMEVISPSLFILPGNLLAYESISQPRKPKGVRSQFSLRLPTLSDNIRVINITQDSQIFARTLKVSSLEFISGAHFLFFI